MIRYHFFTKTKNGTVKSKLVPVEPYGHKGVGYAVPRYHEKQLICLASYVEKM